MLAFRAKVVAEAVHPRRLLGPRLELRRFGEAPLAGRRLEFADTRIAATYVARLMADARDAQVLRSLAAELAYAPAADDRDVVARLAAALVAGQVVLTSARAAAEPRIAGSAAEEGARPDDDDFEVLHERSLTHWVEIQLVGEDGQGVAHQRCLIVTPDGVEWRRFTDSLGFVRLSRIPEGECKISFPDLDAAAWEPISSQDMSE